MRNLTKNIIKSLKKGFTYNLFKIKTPKQNKKNSENKTLLH